jgi:hypothetical protein
MMDSIEKKQELQETRTRREKKEPSLTAPSKGAIEQDGFPAGAGCAGRAMNTTAKETGRSIPEPGTVGEGWAA